MLSRTASWFRTPRTTPSHSPSPGPSTRSRVAAAAEKEKPEGQIAREMADINAAMSAAELIMNDDIEGAEASLSKGDSSFHMLGLGVCAFMRSILGFEKEVMLTASNRLSDCETKAWAEMKKTQRTADGGCQIYKRGAEFQLVISEAQLMGAVVSVLHESLTEGLKGFYKLRKAFITLEALMADEARALQQRMGVNGADAEEKMPGSFDDDEFADVEKEASDSNSSREPSTDAHETPNPDGLSGAATPSSEGAIERELAELRLGNGGLKTPAADLPDLLSNNLGLEPGPDSDMFANPLDAFVHSGANMCFGVLLLILSLVPPTFSKLLYVIGFKGDRDRGLRMLWQSTKFANINGAIAGLILLTYYNMAVSFGDILRSPADLEDGVNDLGGWPRERCRVLLQEMRERYPASGLWKLEEARELSNSRQLKRAMEVLKSNAGARMRQVVALNNFELALTAMFSRDWAEMSRAFVRCVELNDWSHALYWFIAATAEVERYRDAVQAGDEAVARQRKKDAADMLEKAPTCTGKKRFLARPMPFEIYVMHKIDKWQKRAKELGVEVVDAVGVSPAQEMSYLWNAAKRMGTDEMEGSLRDLDWNRLTLPEEKAKAIRDAPDETGVRAVCLSSVLRGLGRKEEARAMLTKTVEMDKNLFKGPGKDDYVQPCALYELAVIEWSEACEAAERNEIPMPSSSNSGSKASSVKSNRPATAEEIQRDSISIDGDTTASTSELETAEEKGKTLDEYRRQKIIKCRALLDRVAKWGPYVLDARMGLRVQSGLENVQWLKERRGWK